MTDASGDGVPERIWVKGVNGWRKVWDLTTGKTTTFVAGGWSEEPNGTPYIPEAHAEAMLERAAQLAEGRGWKPGELAAALRALAQPTKGRK